jgi:hypothetical protein
VDIELALRTGRCEDMRPEGVELYSLNGAGVLVDGIDLGIAVGFQ